MDTQQFLAEFTHVANAPGGVPRLRQLVVSSAVLGRLVAKDPNQASNPAAKVIELASIEKNKLIASGEARRTRPLPPLSVEESSPYPSHWAGTRLENVVHLISGQHLGPEEQNSTGDGIPYFTGASDFAACNPVVTRWTDQRRALAKRGDILIAVKGTIGKINFLDVDEAALGRQLMAIRPIAVNAQFIALILRDKESHFVAQSIGIAIPGISRDDILLLPIGIPPLEEQSRIVTKVDELMALFDKLEGQQQERRKLQSVSRQSTLQAVAAASPRELRTAWTRLDANFGRLFSFPEDVRLLRDVVFDLALRGALLPRTRFSNTSSDEAPALPLGWSWKTLADEEISEYITSGSRSWKTYVANTGDAFIRSQDIKHDALIFENPAFVLLPDKAEGKRTLVQEGDLLLTITGGNVGKCASVPVLSYDAYVSQHVALIRLKHRWLSEFIHLWIINSFGGRRFLSRYIYGDKPGLNLTQVGSVPVPVPPRADCMTILDSLRTYQKLCNQLEKQLKSKQGLASTLAAAAVSSLTGISIEEDMSMKAPETELIAQLRLGTPPGVDNRAPLAGLLVRHNGELPARDLWQRFGGEVDAFYAQLKIEVIHGWIQEPALAEVREKPKETVVG